VIPHLVDGGLSILQYADDTIIFMEHDLEKAKNLKLILSAFEQLFGLKINFRVNCIVLARLKIRPSCMRNYLDATWASFQLGIWGFRFTFGD
jgi:hypothetical protein